MHRLNDNFNFYKKYYPQINFLSVLTNRGDLIYNMAFYEIFDEPKFVISKASYKSEIKNA